jgi:putative polyhydroxyalkanoate system protein
MAHISIQRRHHMSHDAVRQQIETLAQTLKDKLGAQYQWHGDTLKFSRKHASGHIRVSDDHVDVEVRLGLMLRPLKASLERMVTEYLDEHLA